MVNKETESRKQKTKNPLGKYLLKFNFYNVEIQEGHTQPFFFAVKNS